MVVDVRGDLAVTLELPPEQACHAAARAARAQLRFVPEGESKDARQALVVARSASARRVEIRLERDGDCVTRRRIRVSAFGDQTVVVATEARLSVNL